MSYTEQPQVGPAHFLINQSFEINQSDGTFYIKR